MTKLKILSNVNVSRQGLGQVKGTIGMWQGPGNDFEVEEASQVWMSSFRASQYGDWSVKRSSRWVGIDAPREKVISTSVFPYFCYNKANLIVIAALQLSNQRRLLRIILSIISSQWWTRFGSFESKPLYDWLGQISSDWDISVLRPACNADLRLSA